MWHFRGVCWAVSVVALAIGAPTLSLAQTTITRNPDKDNTLYQSTAGTTSNGQGVDLFAGRTNESANFIRRSVIHFDLSAIPAGSTINSVSLSMRLNRAGAAGNANVALHRATANWGEGASNDTGTTGQGTTAATNDATWLHRFYNTQFWTTAGGDFAAAASATTSVSTSVGTRFTWSSAAMAADVQSWITTPANNFGWVVRGDETRAQTSKRFDSRNVTTVANRPILSVVYTPPAPATGACCGPNGATGTCTLLTAASCATQTGSYQGDNSVCVPSPCTLPTGACCSTGSTACTVSTQAACAASAGVYQSDGSVCLPNPCPQPTGACCLTSGLCSVLTSAACAGQAGGAGTYQGNATVCAGQVCPIILTPFVDALPIPAVATPTTGTAGGAAHYDIHMVEVSRRLHRDLPNTTVWGYEGQYPGPTIEARRDQPISVSWINDLRDITTGQLRTQHVLSVDTCLHGPDITGVVPRTVVHLHGLRVAPESDGDPDANFPPGAQSSLYNYPNIQQAATLWYHDHALGITRLNVYMGLAGFYLIRDAAEDALGLPGGLYEVPLVIQDRSFNPDGSLKYLDTWQDHFAGDFILVNGKVWPFLNVRQGKYRFRIVNASGTRVYALTLSNGATFQQIGSDQGLLGAPVPLTQLTIAPGERADIVIDFSAYAAGTEIVLTNSAPVPAPGGPPETVIPNVMKFVVGSQSGSTGALPAVLVSGGVPRTPESDAVIDRPFSLMPVQDTQCPAHGSMWLINGLMWDDITEMPRVGTTEIWSWINRSPDVHSMHIHLVQSQVLDRQDFVLGTDGAVIPVGPRVPPPANEAGWKDTVQTQPGQITRVIQRFSDFSGIFPYHCHIFEHEDHEMMRQFNLLCTAPSISAQPTGGTRCQGANAALTVAAAGDALKFVWRKDGVVIANGPTPTGAVVSGALTGSLLIANAATDDSGNYDCLITNPCGQAATIPASVRFCVADYNCNGAISIQDIFDFITGFFQPSPRADADRSGSTNVQDLFYFLSAWFAGC